MAKASKGKKPVKRGKYDEKLAVNGSFLEIMQAAAKNANDKSAPAKTDLEEKIDKRNAQKKI